MNQKKCSIKKHSEVPAVIYCNECKLFLCNKCCNYHSEIHENHHLYNLEKDLNEIFTGFCDKNNHNNKLQYYCKTHNELCCSECICMIKGEGNGQHKDCKVVYIKEIEKEKKDKLKENIKYLEDISNTLKDSINELNNIIVKLNKSKEELKTKVQTIFTKIRNILNEREDELLLEIDKKINNNYFSEDILKKSEKLPNKIKACLERGKKIDVEWNNGELNNLIYDCISIENNIKDVNIINENIKKYKIKSSIGKIQFISKEDEIIEIIRKFGKIYFGDIFNVESDIIKNNEDKLMISNWINQNVGISLKLLYKVSRDGDRISTFIQKVSGISPTLILIQSKSGFKFGGYTSVEWNMSGSYTYKKDKSAFIFSIDKRKKYKLKRENYAICGDPNHFAFGAGHDLTICDKCTTNNNSNDYLSNNSYEMPEKYELTGGNKSFYVQELEVYQVLFI